MGGQATASVQVDRLYGLDLLRLIALTLVLGRHMPKPPDDLVPWLRIPASLWQRGGWVGVDLFFVLSGFLVAGLLFHEHRVHGRLRLSRFLIRRGFKIYPAFYFCVAFELIARTIAQARPEPADVATELLFLQKYLRPLFSHTWSLAVEEHFYFLLVLLLGWLSIRAKPDIGRDPFRMLAPITAGVAIVALAWRAANVIVLRRGADENLFLTHLRIDSLLFGTFLAYLYHFHNEAFMATGKRFARWMLLIGVAAFIPAFVMDVGSTVFLGTAGLTAFYLAAGLLVTVLVTASPASMPSHLLVTRLAACSYGIYLWHIPIKNWCLPLILGAFGRPIVWPISVAVYLALGVGVGVAMTMLIERPMLRLRDRLFPSTRCRPGSLPRPKVSLPTSSEFQPA